MKIIKSTYLKWFTLTCIMILLVNRSFSQPQKEEIIIDSLIKSAEKMREKEILRSKDLTLNILQKAKKIDYNKGIAFSLKNLATIYLFQSEINLAVETYQEAIVYFKKENFVRGVADCLNNIALAYTLNSNFDTAQYYYRQNLEIEIWLDDKVGIAQTHENIGILYYYQGYPKRALSYFLQAAITFNRLKEFKKLNSTLVNISSIISDMGYHHLSIRLHKGVLFMAQYFENIRVVSNCYNNIGFSYSNIGEYSKALEYLNYALIVKEQLGDKEGTMITLGVIGSIYRSQQKFDLSNQMYTNIIKLAEEVGNKRQSAIGLTYIGENLRLQGDYDKAINYYNHSNEILETVGALNELKENHQYLSFAYFQKKDYKNASNHYKRYKQYLKKASNIN